MFYQTQEIDMLDFKNKIDLGYLWIITVFTPCLLLGYMWIITVFTSCLLLGCMWIITVKQCTDTDNIHKTQNEQNNTKYTSN
jgi:hypothetical protein